MATVNDLSFTAKYKLPTVAPVVCRLLIVDIDFHDYSISFSCNWIRCSRLICRLRAGFH